MSVRGGSNTLGPASHLKRTDPIASQGVGDAGAGKASLWRLRDPGNQPSCQASAWSPSSDHIEVCASVVLRGLQGAFETAGGIAVSFALAARVMLPVAFAQLVIMIRIGLHPAALFVVGKTGGGNFRDHSEVGQQLGLVLGIGFGHDVGAVAGGGTKTDKGWDIAGFSIRFPNIDRTVRVS